MGWPFIKRENVYRRILVDLVESRKIHMPFQGKYLEIHSWGKSVFLKGGILGLGCMAIFFAGWPQPSITSLDHSSLRSKPQAVQKAHHELTPASSISNNESLRAQQQGRNVTTVNGPSLVNLNLSSGNELESLPGIGKTLAGRIVAYRSTHGVFQRVNDLVKVSGIGEKRLQRLLPYVTVESNIEDL